MQRNLNLDVIPSCMKREAYAIDFARQIGLCYWSLTPHKQVKIGKGNKALLIGQIFYHLVTFW